MKDNSFSMANFLVNHSIESVSEGAELVLADSSVLSEGDVLVSLALQDQEKAKVLQEARAKVKNKQVKKGANSHSYLNNPGRLEHYDEPKKESFNLFSENLSEVPESPRKVQKIPEKKEPFNFAVPKKRVRIIDLAEQDSPSENQNKSKLTKTRKLPKFQEEDDRLELELKINSLSRPSLKSTPQTQEEEMPIEIEEDLKIIPKNLKIDPSLSLKHSGSTSVVFLSLPTERIQSSETVKNVKNDWEHHDRPLGRGLAACLEVMREKKLLGKSKLLGRKKDGPSDPDLQHFDEKGRVLTKKQAFRMQCYNFHNQKPNLSKIQKIENEMKAEGKADKLDPALGTSSFRHVKSIMQKTKNNYVVFSKH
jgi:hypothetical protein